MAHVAIFSSSGMLSTSPRNALLGLRGRRFRSSRQPARIGPQGSLPRQRAMSS